MQGKPHKLSIAVAIIFFAGLSVGFLNNENGHYSLLENRALSPDWDIPKTFDGWMIFPRVYDEYIQDHFGNRNIYSVIYGLKQKAIGVPVISDIREGRDGWFFIETAATKNSYGRPNYLANESLHAWGLYLDRRFQWLSERGIAYVFLVVPNKHTVYYDKNPLLDSVDIQNRRSNQFRKYMSERTKVPVLDPSDALLRVRQHDGASGLQLYNKTEPHWNVLGAAYAMQSLERSLSESISGLTTASVNEEEFTFTSRDAYGFLTRFPFWPKATDMEVVANGLPSCAAAMLKLEDPFGVWQGSYRAPFKTYCPSGTPLRVLVFRDSFMTTMQPFLSARFSEVSYVWTYGQDDELLEYYVELLKPDLVIEQLTERYLGEIRTTRLRLGNH